jgi:branched-chain amino acid transport system permease protein
VGDDILARYKNWLISLAFLLVFVGLPAVVGGNAYLMLILCLSGIFIIASIGLDLLFGYSGQISIGQAAFYAVGAYTSAILTTKVGVNVWVGMLAGCVLATIFAALVAIPICKLVHMFLALVTIGIGELTHQAIINLPDLTGSFTGVRGIPMPRIGGYVFNVSSYYYIVLAIVVLSLLVKQRIVDSRIGRAFIAIRENTDAANAMGINVTYYKVVAFACSAAFTGIAGALYAHYIGFISPESFTLDQSVLFLTAVLCGGMGTFVGPIIGAVVITVINEAIQVLGSYQMLVYGIFIVVAVMYVPEGLVGVVKMIQRNLLKVVNRVAD